MADEYLTQEGEPIQAMRLDEELVTAVSVWCSGLIVEEIDPFDGDKRFPGLNVQCGDEVKRANLGDYIVKHNDGTFDVVKPAKFLNTHIGWESTNSDRHSS